MRVLPREIRARFKSLHCSSKVGYAVEVARFLLDNYDHPTSHQQRVLEALARGRQSEGKLRYEAFIQRMADTVAPSSFMPWHTLEDGGCLAPPSEKVIRTIFNQAFDRIQPYLQQALQEQSVGICLSGDGTHRIGGRSKGDTAAVHFVMNDDSYVVAYGAAASDSIGPMIPLYMGLRAMAERQNGLSDVRAVYLDTCCDQRLDVSDTPMAHIFPSVSGVSGDGFHLGNRITRTTHPHHPAHAQFAFEVGRAIRQPHIPDHTVVAQALLRNPPKGRRRQPCADLASAERLAWADAYKSSIRTQALPAPTIADNLRKLRDNKGDQGTLEAFNNAIACCEKGCYTSPFHFAESHKLLYVKKELGIHVYASIGHTGKNEAFHSKVNRLLDYISTISEDQLEKRLMLLVFHHNRGRDIALNKCRDGTPYPWEVNTRATELQVFKYVCPQPRSCVRSNVVAAHTGCCYGTCARSHALAFSSFHFNWCCNFHFNWCCTSN
ncbi:hypothetical protein JKP88DRAFT_201968 [Tribonema minus]|uniref:Uncharacterized protein n=1 Tax=Tribonema minus TaxID=303371 RepID=A0A836CA97_9STRA|nr:hypothetical protein JKP88DRAFT_201967 [Tribonema minus]KAG5178048.1 hypothetical protein JKP88DRAFT_201968 [Tribonema minus]